MANSVVGNNTKRILKVEEFRGFALVDEYAPLIFLNGADSKAARMFTLAHELAHIWLGQSGISNIDVTTQPTHDIELWCNRVAAEFLLPLDVLCEMYNDTLSVRENVKLLVNKFKVSSLVVLRRLLSANLIEKEQMWEMYANEITQFQNKRRKSGGGSFYNTVKTRIGKRFSQALIASTLEGDVLFRDAFSLLSIKTSKTFYDIARHMGIIA